MQVIEIMRRYARDLGSLAKSIRSGEIGNNDPSENTEVQRQTANSYADTYEYWEGCLLMAASLLKREVDEHPHRYMGIGIEKWTGLKDRDGDNLNFDDVVEAPPPEEGSHRYYQIKFVQDENGSKIMKVTKQNQTDLGTEAASRLKRIGPGSEHPELLKLIKGTTGG